MSAPIEDDEESATRMMSSRSLLDDAEAEAAHAAFEKADGDSTVPMTQGVLFAKLRPAAGAAARAAVQTPVQAQETDGEIVTSSVTVPMARDDLPLRRAPQAAESGELTVPQRRIPVSERGPRTHPMPSSQAVAERLRPAYEAPPAAHRPSHSPEPEPPPPPPPPPLPPPPPFAQNPGPAAPLQPAYPASERGLAPSVRTPSIRPQKLRSPPIFVAVMVACSVLTITGLVLLAYLKMRHFW
jgi:hypothetical protein